MDDTPLHKIFSATTSTLSQEDRDLLERAYNFAKEAHHGQERKSGEPYVTHSLAVATNCATLGADTTTIVAALLHDTLEDTAVTEEMIEKAFGKEVLFLVEGVTKLGKLKYQGVERHVESMRKFFIALAEDARVLIIKLADRLHNIETLSHIPKEKQYRIALETIEVYAPLAGRLGMGKLKGILEDHAFPFAFPDAYKKTKALSERLIPEAQKLMEFVKKEIEEACNTFSLQATVQARVKHLYSLYKKLEKYEWNEEKIHDIVALRVIVKNIPDCYQLLGLIHMLWKPLPGRIKDWIALPKNNGYKSLHTTVLTEYGTTEIQIRTQEMHDEAEYGIASHLIYKQTTVGSTLSEKEQHHWLNQLKELSTLVESMHDLEELKLDFFNDRIFVFTPNGDVIDLPEGSTPIDFAYAIHSDIGNALHGARINGKMVSIETKLTRGDIVEILTGKHSTPSSKWLSHAKTSFARRKIRNALEGKGEEH